MAYRDLLPAAGSLRGRYSSLSLQKCDRTTPVWYFRTTMTILSAYSNPVFIGCGLQTDAPPSPSVSAIRQTLFLTLFRGLKSRAWKDINCVAAAAVAFRKRRNELRAKNNLSLRDLYRALDLLF